MKGMLAEIANMVKDFGSAPTFAEMPRKTLSDKGIAGPTAAHTIEEVHTYFYHWFICISEYRRHYLCGITAKSKGFLYCIGACRT